MEYTSDAVGPFNELLYGMVQAIVGMVVHAEIGDLLLVHVVAMSVQPPDVVCDIGW